MYNHVQQCPYRHPAWLPSGTSPEQAASKMVFGTLCTKSWCHGWVWEIPHGLWDSNVSWQPAYSISSTNWHVQNCSIRFVAFPHEFESPFESIDSEICIDLLRVEVTPNYPGDTASCSKYAPSQTQRSHIWLFHSELRTMSTSVTLMCETAATHIGIPPNLLGIRWNQSFVSWRLRQGSSFATALADLPHGSFDWSSHQMSILAKILAKLCYPSFGWNNSQILMFAKMLVKLHDPSSDWNPLRMSISAKMLAALPRSSFGWNTPQNSNFAKMLAMLRDLSSDWSSSQRSIFAKMLAKLCHPSFG